LMKQSYLYSADITGQWTMVIGYDTIIKCKTYTMVR
jgi:hypothetical protein